MYCVGVIKNSKLWGYVHYEMMSQSYFFSTNKVGCCVWKDNFSVAEFIANTEVYESDLKLLAIDLSSNN